MRCTRRLKSTELPSITFASRIGWKEVEIESDSIVVVAVLNKIGASTMEVSMIMVDCMDLMGTFGSCIICHVYREANNVVDRLVYFASKGHVVDHVLH